MGAALVGTTTANITARVASFSGLSITLGGAGYTLTASSPGLNSATSNSLNVRAAYAVPGTTILSLLGLAGILLAMVVGH